MTDTSKAELDRLFEKQKAAFLADNNPSYEQRMEWLQAMEKMMVDLRQPIRDALGRDFDSHPELITDLFETGGVLGRCRNAMVHLQEWMAPEERPLLDVVHGSSRCEVVKQPKGVMGNIAPWNFPIECSLVMVVDMLAAGNRVIVKMSELAPVTAGLIRESVGKYFPGRRAGRCCRRR